MLNTIYIREVELSYIAGLTDGDGSISISGTNNVTVTLYNLHKGVLLYVQELLGGYYAECIVRGYLRRWLTISSFQAEVALKELLPYLKIKKRAAVIGLLYRRTIGKCGGLVTKPIIEKRLWYTNRIKHEHKKYTSKYILARM